MEWGGGVIENLHIPEKLIKCWMRKIQFTLPKFAPLVAVIRGISDTVTYKTGNYFSCMVMTNTSTFWCRRYRYCCVYSNQLLLQVG